MRAMGRAEDQWRRQFVRRTRKASYPGGRIEHVTDEWRAFGRKCRHRDPALWFGRNAPIGEMGHAGGKLVLLLAVTGGDAADLWKKIADEWKTKPVVDLR